MASVAHGPTIFSNAMWEVSQRGGVGHDSSFDTTVARDERIVIPMEAQKHQSGVVRSPSQQTSRFSSLSMSSSLDDT